MKKGCLKKFEKPYFDCSVLDELTNHLDINDETFSTIFSVCGSFWYPGFADYVVNNNVKNRNAAVYLLNGEQEGVNHGNLLEQAPVKAHMVHEHLMSVMNAVSIFDEYGHHENKSERINRIVSGIL